MFWQLFNPIGQARYQTLTLLDQGAILQINTLRNRPGGRFVYNKATYWIYRFASNYVSYFSPSFLFVKGGSHYQFSIAGAGLVFVTLLPFMLLGLVKLIQNKCHSSWVWLWLLLYPIAGSVTRDSPHTLRAIILLPVLPLIIAWGIAWIVKGRLWLTYLLPGLLSVEIINYMFKVRDYTQDYSWVWQYGNAEMVNYVKAHYHEYDQILITKKYGEPHVFVAYYWPWSPKDYQESKVWNYHANWYWVDGLDKIRFVDDWKMKDKAATLREGTNNLVIYSPENSGPGDEILKINFLNNQPAYILKEL